MWSPSGRLVAVLASPSVLVLDGRTRKQLAALTCPETKAVAFSASEALLQTHQTSHKVNGAAAPNLKVQSACCVLLCSSCCGAVGCTCWCPDPACCCRLAVGVLPSRRLQHRLCWQLWDWASQEVKLQLVHRALDRDAWPTLQLTRSEDAAYHAVASAVACHTLTSQADGAACCRSRPRILHSVHACAAHQISRACYLPRCQRSGHFPRQGAKPLNPASDLTLSVEEHCSKCPVFKLLGRAQQACACTITCGPGSTQPGRAASQLCLLLRQAKLGRLPDAWLA